MSKALRILILEDQPADAELVAHELRKASFEFAAKTVATMVPRAGGNRPSQPCQRNPMSEDLHPEAQPRK